MSTNSHTPAAAPLPGPRCAAYQPLLPILRTGDVDAPSAEELRAHLATCAYCRAELAAYDALDASLRRHFAPPSAAGAAPEASAPRTADLLAALGLDPTAPDRAAPSLGATHGAARAPRPRRLRTTLSGMGSLAAVLLIAVLAQLLFASHGRPSVPRGTGSQVGPGDPGDTPTPTIIGVAPGTYQTLSAISMLSPEEGWAAGIATNYAVKNAPWSTLLYHYHQGQWTPERAPNVGVVTAIQMLSPTDGWITGQQGLLRYDGAGWQPVSLDPLTVSGFGPLQMLSADDGWLVANGNTLLRYQNGHWSAIQSITSVPGISGDASVNIHALRMRSPSDGWAVGDALPSPPQPPPSTSSNNVPQPLPIGLILRYDGRQWRIAATYPHTSFASLGLLGPVQGWIGGGDYYNLSAPYRGLQGSHPLLLSLSGGAWTRAALPSLPPDTSLVNDITAQPELGAWLIVNRDGGGPITFDGSTMLAQGGTVLLHEQQGRWVSVPMPAVRDRDAASIQSLWMVSPDEGWAVGTASWPQSLTGITNSTSMPSVVTPLILHYQHGVWSIAAS